jgi:hypothetical protein
MNIKKSIIIIYVILTVIKLFTARIDHVREEDPTIYFKFVPTISNVFLRGGDTSGYREMYESRHSWYKNMQYWEICHGNNSSTFNFVYETLIFLWWLASAGLIYFALYQLFIMTGNGSRIWRHRGTV